MQIIHGNLWPIFITLFLNFLNQIRWSLFLCEKSRPQGSVFLPVMLVPSRTVYISSVFWELLPGPSASTTQAKGLWLPRNSNMWNHYRPWHIPLPQQSVRLKEGLRGRRQAGGHTPAPTPAYVDSPNVFVPIDADWGLGNASQKDSYGAVPQVWIWRSRLLQALLFYCPHMYTLQPSSVPSCTPQSQKPFTSILFKYTSELEQFSSNVPLNKMLPVAGQGKTVTC